MPPGQKSFAVINQQNVVSSGQQHVQYVDRGQGKETLLVRDELKGNTASEGDLHELRERIARGEEPAPGGCREDKRGIAAAMGA
jgi:hypothetical protein